MTDVWAPGCKPIPRAVEREQRLRAALRWEAKRELRIAQERSVAHRKKIVRAFMRPWREIEMACAHRLRCMREAKTERQYNERWLQRWREAVVQPIEFVCLQLAAIEKQETLRREIVAETAQALRTNTWQGGYARQNMETAKFWRPVAHRSPLYIAAWLARRGQRLAIQ